MRNFVAVSLSLIAVATGAAQSQDGARDARALHAHPGDHVRAVHIDNLYTASGVGLDSARLEQRIDDADAFASARRTSSGRGE